MTLEPGTARALIAEAVGEAVAAVGARAIAAAGVTSQRTGVVFVDEGGTELAVMPNADGRAFAEGLAQEQQHGETIYRIAGRLPAMLYLPARYAWMRANEPDAAACVRYALSFGDWIVHALTGEAATDPTQAAELLVYDVAAGDWSDELLSMLGVPRSILPPILEPGAAAGESTGALGLPPGIPVVPAGADTQCAALAMGMIERGDAFVVSGTTMLCEHVRADAAIDPQGRFWTSPLPAGGFVQEAHCGESGSAIEWVASIIGLSVSDLSAMADDGQPGSGGAVFVDPWPSVASDFALIRSGALFFPAPVLALGRPRADIARAVFEGIAFAARWGLEQLATLNGEPRRLAVAGGVARSHAFLEALAGSTERTVTVATEPASSALGAAICAAASSHGGVAQAAVAMADRGREVAPDPAHGYPAHDAAWRQRAAEIEARAITRKGLSG